MKIIANMKQYSKKEVKQMLAAVFIFSGANNNQGILEIPGITYGDKIDTIIKSYDASLGLQDMVRKLSK